MVENTGILIILITDASQVRRHVARDPSANPSPPLGRRSSSSSPAERGPSPGRGSVTRGPPRQRQPPPPLALPPPSGGRRTGSAAVKSSTSKSSSKTSAAGRTGKPDRQHRGQTVKYLIYDVGSYRENTFYVFK